MVPGESTSAVNLKDKGPSRTKQYLILAAIIPLIPLILLVVLIVSIGWLIIGAWLGLRVRLQWYPKGKRLLFVYSNSPNWKDYIEATLLPKIQQQAVIVNWSDRNQWNWRRKPLELRVFRHWAGVNRYLFHGKVTWDGDEFNPIAITFIPWWRRRVFRFWQPFKDFKHGKERPLKQLEAKLLELLEAV